MKIQYKNVTAEFLEINKKIADEFLIKNINNRKIDNHRVSKYIDDMNSGYWCMNGDAIRFCEDGYLIDGQHRLAAISRTNKSFVFLVIRNVQKESKRTIDTGKTRTGADVLTMFSNVGNRDSGVLSAAIQKIILYEQGRSITVGGGNGITLSAIEEFYKKNYLKLNDSLIFISKKIDHHAMLLSRSESLFLHYIFSAIDKSLADEFMEKIITGIGIQDGTNEYLYRNILTKRAMKTVKVTPTEAIYTGIRAWNRNRKGGTYSSESNLKFSAREAIPFAY